MQKTVFLILAILVGALSLFAHHGTNASYDPDKSVTLTGTVTEWIFSNPHSQIGGFVITAAIKVVHWGGELQSPGNLRRDGWSKTTFKAGDQITLTVHPSRAGTPVGVVDRSKPVVVNGNPLPAPTPGGE